MPKRQKPKGPRIKAIAHPTRSRILSHLLLRGTSSPKQMAAALDEKLGNISYHTDVLREYDCVELVRTEPRRGAVEHFYRAKPDAAPASLNWQEVPAPLRGDLAAAAMNDLTTGVVQALQVGTFQCRAGSLVSTLPLVLDEPGWEELLKILRAVEGQAREILQRAAGRMNDPAEGVSFLLGLVAVETGTSRDGRQDESHGSAN